MKPIALYIFAIPFLFGACQSKCVEDLGIHVTRDLALKPYNEIKVSGPVKLILRQDSSYKVNIAADSNVIGLVKAAVNGHELRVAIDPKMYCGKDSIIVSAGIGELRKIEAGPTAKIYTSSSINVGDLVIKLAGATVLNLELNAAKLTLDNDGAANINLSGHAGAHELKSKGAIDLKAYGFIAGIYDIDIEGTGKAKINVLNDLKVRTTGATEILYKGNPKNVDEKKTGVSKLEKVN